MKLKQKFMKGANEDGFSTLEQLETLLQKYPITKNNPILMQLYLRVKFLKKIF